MFRILLLKNAMNLLFTGLKRMVGAPQEFQQNLANNTFGNNFDLSIPLNETDQGRKNGGPARLDDISSHFNQMNVRSPMNGQAQNMGQQRTMAGGSNHHQ